MLRCCVCTNADAAEDEGNCSISGIGGGRGDFSQDEGVPMLSSREDAENEASGQPAPSEGCGQGRRPGLGVVVPHGCVF